MLVQRQGPGRDPTSLLLAHDDFVEGWPAAESKESAFVSGICDAAIRAGCSLREGAPWRRFLYRISALIAQSRFHPALLRHRGCEGVLSSGFRRYAA